MHFYLHLLDGLNVSSLSIKLSMCLNVMQYYHNRIACYCFVCSSQLIMESFSFIFFALICIIHRKLNLSLIDYHRCKLSNRNVNNNLHVGLSSNTKTRENNATLSSGALAGIIIACLFVVTVSLSVAFYFLCCRKKKETHVEDPERI